MVTDDPNRPLDPVGPEDEGVGNIRPDEAPGPGAEDEGIGNVRPIPGSGPSEGERTRKAGQVDAQNERTEDAGAFPARARSSPLWTDGSLPSGRRTLIEDADERSDRGAETNRQADWKTFLAVPAPP